MANCDYPIDFRADRPEQSSRGWAVLTILLIKLLALIPHFFVLLFLNIAQAVVAVVAQVGVVFTGRYPTGMFDFVAGVLRWNARVQAFVYSLSDQYPPFSLRPESGYSVDVIIERPASSSRVYAAFALLVEALFLAGIVWLAIWALRQGETLVGAGNGNSTFSYNTNFSGGSYSGLILRQIAALPHLIVLAFIGIGAFVVWVIVQWVILFGGSYPQGLYDFTAGYTRWQTRVTGYTLGLSDRYPPFTFQPSLAGSAPAWPTAPPAGWPPPPAPPTPGQAPPPGAPPAPPPQAPGGEGE